MTDIANPPGVAETFVPRSSTHIASITYEPDVENMTVEFQGDGADTYTYFNVPRQTYRDWCAEGGTDAFFRRRVKLSFSYERQ